MGILNKIKKGKADTKKNPTVKINKEQVTKSAKEEIQYVRTDFKGIIKQLKTKESIVEKNEVIAILHRGPKNEKSFLVEFKKLTKEGYKLSAITDTRGLPITPFGFNIKTGKLFFFQHSKWLS